MNTSPDIYSGIIEGDLSERLSMLLDPKRQNSTGTDSRSPSASPEDNLKTGTGLPKPKFTGGSGDNESSYESSNRLDYLVYAPSKRASTGGARSREEQGHTPPYSNRGSPSGLSPLENLSVAQLSALAPFGCYSPLPSPFPNYPQPMGQLPLTPTSPHNPGDQFPVLPPISTSKMEPMSPQNML